VIDAFRELDAEVLVQEFIKVSGGCDIRCFVIGNKVVAAMQRTAKEGDFRSNLHRGGSASVVKISPEERSTAVRAARTMGLAVAGVDILRSSRGPLVIEVNSSPGLEGIEKATGKDVAARIIAHVELTARPNSNKTLTKG
jgi:ribosomal protein S6--L-glutamate ligase